MEHRSRTRGRPPTLALAVLAALACTGDETAAPTATTLVDIRSVVTPSLAATLTSEGTFSDVVATGEAGRAVITAARAKELALAYMRQFGPYVRDYVERAHGRRVDFAALSAESVFWLPRALTKHCRLLRALLTTRLSARTTSSSCARRRRPW
jgi:hypothetical protein